MEENLRVFLLEHVVDTDIFCFQEAESRFTLLAEELLGGFACITERKGSVEHEDNYTNSTYVRSDLAVSYVETLLQDVTGCGLALYTEVVIGGKKLALINMHGEWQPGTKIDTEERLRQSRTLIEFLDGKDGPRIIGGDFNLLLETESVTLFERAGYKNLIRDWGIKTTRNQISWDMWPDLPKQFWADFVFVSPEVEVKSFQVPEDDRSSDHLPMILELDL